MRKSKRTATYIFRTQHVRGLHIFTDDDDDNNVEILLPSISSSTFLHRHLKLS